MRILCFDRSEERELMKSWFGPARGGSHVKHAPHEDGRSGGSGGYHDGQILPATEAAKYFESEISGKDKGAVVRNPTFVIGKLSPGQVSAVAKYLHAENSPAELRITGRSIKHAHERRTDIVRDVVGELSQHFIDNAVVLPNHKDKDKVLLVSTHKRTPSNKSYVSAVGLEVSHGALYVSSFMSMPDRTLRQAVDLGSNWQEGQHPPGGDSPHPVAPHGAHAEAGFSGVQSIGDSTIPKELKKSSGPMIIFLKATTTKTVTIPAFTDKNGRFVAAHSKLVHFDPDKSVADVISGKGSHSQKKAHAKLSKYPGFKDLHETDQYHHILSSGTNIQKKASASAALSAWKSSAMAGKFPSSSQWEAFYPLPKDKQDALFAEVKAKVGDIEFLNAPPEPPETVGTESPAVADPVAAFPLSEKPAYDHVAQAGLPGKPTVLSASEEWLAANPGKADELSSSLVDLGLMSVAKLMGIYKPPTLPSEKKEADDSFHQSEAEKAVASAKLAEVAAGHGGHYPGLAYKKLSASLGWSMYSPVEQLEMVVKLAKELQATASASAAVSGWKKAAMAGNNPTPSQWAAFQAIPDDKKSAMLDAVKHKWGGWDHLKHPDAPAPKSAKAISLAGLQSAYDKTYGHQPKVILPVGPKNGDTKTGANGETLTFKNGRWHKYVNADESGELPAVLVPVADPDVGSVLSSASSDPITATEAGMSAKQYLLKEEDFASSAIGAVGPEMVEYVMASADKWLAANPGKKAELNAALDALGYPFDEPAPASQPKTTSFGTDNPDVVFSTGGYLVKFDPVMDQWLYKDHHGNWIDVLNETLISALNSGQNVDGEPLAKMDPDPVAVPAAVAAVEPSFSTYHNTTEGHYKSWSVAVDGNKMITKHGKIGAKQSSTVKEFASHDAAVNAAHKLMDQKKAKGYFLFDDSGAPSGSGAPVASSKPKKPIIDGEVWSVAADNVEAAINSGNLQHILDQMVLSSGMTSPAASALNAYAVAGHAFLVGKKAGPADGDTKQGADGTLVFKDGHWHKQGDAPAAPAKKSPDGSGPTVAIQKAKNPGAALMTGWTQTGPQKGSNPGGQFKDKAGQQWYCKFPSDPDVVKNEFLAAKLYQMLGVSVPNLKLVEQDGKLGIASKWVDGLSKGTAAQLAQAKGAHEAFAIDAWIGNWDVVGLSNDNLMLGKDGAVRVDVGGSLLYRAQGGAKGAAFGNEVVELQTLLDPGTNDKSAAVFGGVTKDGMSWGAGQLAKLKPGQISDLCRKVGPGDSVQQDALAQKLIARRADILKKLGIEDPWNKPPMDESHLPVNLADMPKPHDFANFNGPGKGLSSSAKLNEQNTKDDVALIAFAAQGNLTALKAYHYDAISKETGAFIGKKPITEHPSKWVKEHWAYLVETLDMIAHPSIKGLDMPPLHGSDAQEVANTVKSFSPGEMISTIASDKRLGMWMKQGWIDSDTLDAIVPKAKLHFTTAMRAASISNWWPKVSKAVKGYVSAVQATGWVNHVYSKGDKAVSVSNYDGGVQGLAAQVYSDAIESPEGTEIYRWMSMPHAMMQQLLAEKPGLVFQNTDSMCASYNPSWANSSHFGSDCLMKIRFSKGAKAIHSFASGAFKSENEITTLMGASFVLLSSKQGNVSNSSGIEIEVLMLPPSESYVSELQSQAALGKSMILFFVKEAA